MRSTVRGASSATDVAIKLAADRSVRTEAAADENVIALDRIVVLVRLHLAGQQPDFGYEVLRAGMMAAGQMNIDRRVERDARLAPARDGLGVALGVGRGELAAGVAGAGDKAGADRIGLDRKTRAPRCALRLPQDFRSVRRRSEDFARP